MKHTRLFLVGYRDAPNTLEHVQHFMAYAFAIYQLRGVKMKTAKIFMSTALKRLGCQQKLDLKNLLKQLMFEL